MSSAWRLIGAAVCGVALAVTAVAVDWSSVPLIEHRTYQAVNVDGSSAYAGGFPVRLRGVVAHDPADWLSQAPGYTPEYTPFVMGGEWELFVQAVDEGSGDFGGTAVYLAQNYGNLPWLGDPDFSYTDAEWLAEVERVSYDAETGVAIAVGDLVEVRARAGLHYQGKMNVNEQHNIDPAKDFELVIVQAGYGVPAAAPLTLSDLKDAADVAIFDPTRQTGGERWQGSRVQVRDVWLLDDTGWGPGGQVLLADETGRTLNARLGQDEGFTSETAPAGRLHVTGIMNQSAATGVGGYYLIVMRATDLAPAVVCGDVNCDGVVDTADIDAFVQAIVDPDGYAAAWPGCDISAADVNGDGVVDTADIDGFVAAVVAGGCL